MPAEMTLYQMLPLMSNWPDLGYMGTTSRAWENTRLCLPASIIKESKGEGSVYRQSIGAAVSDRPKTSSTVLTGI